MSLKAPRLALIGLLLVAAVCVRLGFWQLHRLHQRREFNRSALAARQEPPVRIPGASVASSEGSSNRRAIASGRYDHDRDIVLRGQSFQGVPGVEVITPLRLTGSDTAILVNRGFVPAPDAMSAALDSLQEPGEQVVEGIAVAVTSGSGKPLRHAGRVTWAQLDLEALQRELPYPILPIYLRQSPGPALPSFPRRLPPPPLDDGPHLSYAVQWFLFAAMALGFGLVIGLRTGGHRRAP